MRYPDIVITEKRTRSERKLSRYVTLVSSSTSSPSSHRSSRAFSLDMSISAYIVRRMLLVLVLDQ